MGKIQMGLPKPGGKKKGANKLLINGFLIVIGDSLKIDYIIEEEKSSYSYSAVL